MTLTKIGSDTYKIIITDAITGSGTSASPAGGASDTNFYLSCAEPNIQKKYSSSVKVIAGGKTRLTPDRKKQQTLQISDAIIMNTDINAAISFIDGVYDDGDKLYGFVYFPNNSGSYDKLYWSDEDIEMCSYLKGIITQLNIKLTAGKVYRASITMVEAYR